MGIVRMGPPEELVMRLQKAVAARTFVETGTYRGSTAAWAARHFERVVTVEASPELHAEATRAHSGLANVEFLLGDSREALAVIVPALSEPTMFWLDCHWSGGITYGEGDECPLLDELGTILSSPHEHAILIDDAHMFESAPPLPHDPVQWPSIDQIIELLLRLPVRPSIAIIEDVIVAAPPSAHAALVSYCQDVNARAWETHGADTKRSAARMVSRIRRAAVRARAGSGW